MAAILRCFCSVPLCVLVLLGLYLGSTCPSLACKLAPVGNQACNVTNCNRLQGNIDFADGTSMTNLDVPGGINYRFFTTLLMGDAIGANSTFKGYFFVNQLNAPFVQDCCSACAAHSQCVIFRHFPQRADDIPQQSLGLTQMKNSRNSIPTGGWPVIYPPPFPNRPLSILRNYEGYDPTGAKGNCVLFGSVSPLYKDKDGKDCAGPTVPGCFNQPLTIGTGGAAPTDIDPSTGLIKNLEFVSYNSITQTWTMGPRPGVTGRPRSYWGGACTQGASVVNDPHFVGGDGVRFDFNGAVGKSFCLISDKEVHINMGLGGYHDTRRLGRLLDSTGKTIRTWITELAFLWKGDGATRHRLVLKARSGKTQERGAGFLSSVTLDGIQQPFPKQLGDSLEFDGLKLSLDYDGKHGPYEVEGFSIQIGSVFFGSFRMRVAHPLLQTETEAYAHFNLRVEKLTASESVHGVLGQTFRHDAVRSAKAIEYQMLAYLLKGEMHADDRTGAGYIDGSVADYVTSGIEAPDCRYASY